MVYGFMCSCLFSRSICAFSLTETNGGGTGKILKTRKTAVKALQLIHKFNVNFKNAVLPLKHNSTNSFLKHRGESAAVPERKGTACVLLGDLLLVATPHVPLRCHLQRPRPLRRVGASLLTSKYSQAGFLSQHLHGKAMAPSN